jgi:hypothetical protein
MPKHKRDINTIYLEHTEEALSGARLHLAKLKEQIALSRQLIEQSQVSARGSRELMGRFVIPVWSSDWRGGNGASGSKKI